jgi:hypothetical protein
MSSAASLYRSQARPSAAPRAPLAAAAVGGPHNPLLRAVAAPPRERRLAAPRGERLAALLPRRYSGAGRRGRGPLSGALRAAPARRRRYRCRGAGKSRHLLLVLHLGASRGLFGLGSWTTNT